jgi:hypothetical protein
LATAAIVDQQKTRCDASGELRHGGQRRKVLGLQARIAWRLSREWEISMAEIARQLGVSTSGIANAILVVEGEVKSD